MNQIALKQVTHKEQRVLTTSQLAESYETESKIISNNFNRNSERFIEGVHYYKLEGEILKEYKLTNPQIDESSKINCLYLWTEKGCLLHAKSLNTDKAWQVYEMLVDTYFRTKDLLQTPKTYVEALEAALQLAKQLEEQKALVQFAETCKASKDSILVRELAKLASKEGIKIGQNRLYAFLRKMKMIFQNSNEPYQEYIDKGVFEVTQKAIETSSGVKLCKTTRVTADGQIYIINKLKQLSI